MLSSRQETAPMQVCLVIQLLIKLSALLKQAGYHMLQKKPLAGHICAQSKPGPNGRRGSRRSMQGQHLGKSQETSHAFENNINFHKYLFRASRLLGKKWERKQAEDETKCNPIIRLHVIWSVAAQNTLGRAQCVPKMCAYSSTQLINIVTQLQLVTTFSTIIYARGMSQCLIQKPDATRQS